MKSDRMNAKKVLYAASTASHLRRFHQPYLEALKEDFDVFTMANGEGVDFSVPFQKSIFSVKNLGAVCSIRKILKQQRFDAVILNTALAAFLIRVAMFGMRHRPRVLNIVHGYLFDFPPKGKKDRLMLWCEKLTARYTDEIAVMNQDDLQIVQMCSLSRGKSRFMCGMGYTLSKKNLSVDQTLRSRIAPTEDYLLTFVGELSGRKNQTFLIRCVAKLRSEGLPIRLMLVGEGSERERLESEIAQYGLSDFVTLTGNQEPVLPYLSITDLYVSASRIEGLPFNLMEAMAVGLPIVASDCKGQTDLLTEQAQSLYPLENEIAFCQAVEQAYKSNLRGVGAVSYPNLEQFTLEAVFETNLNMMKGFLTYESNEN